MPGTDSIEKLKYDSNGNIIEEKVYHDNKLINRYSYDNKYDKKDRLVERVMYKNVNQYGEQRRIPIAKIQLKITEFWSILQLANSYKHQLLKIVLMPLTCFILFICKSQ